jgi:hypothetical protein
MLVHGYATLEMQHAMEAAFTAVQARREVAFRYGAVRLICQKPAP